MPTTGLARFLPTDEGGRRSPPAANDYKAVAKIGDVFRSCRVTHYEDPELGKWVWVLVELLVEDVPFPSEFSIQEGSRVVAHVRSHPPPWW